MAPTPPKARPDRTPPRLGLLALGCLLLFAGNAAAQPGHAAVQQTIPVSVGNVNAVAEVDAAIDACIDAAADVTVTVTNGELNTHVTALLDANADAMADVTASLDADAHLKATLANVAMANDTIRVDLARLDMLDAKLRADAMAVAHAKALVNAKVTGPVAVDLDASAELLAKAEAHLALDLNAAIAAQHQLLVDLSILSGDPAGLPAELQADIEAALADLPGMIDYNVDLYAKLKVLVQLSLEVAVMAKVVVTVPTDTVNGATGGLGLPPVQVPETTVGRTVSIATCDVLPPLPPGTGGGGGGGGDDGGDDNGGGDDTGGDGGDGGGDGGDDDDGGNTEVPFFPSAIALGLGGLGLVGAAALMRRRA